MIEPNGPYGLKYTRTVAIKVMTILSDGEWHSVNDIAERIGARVNDVSNTITSKHSGLIEPYGLETRQTDDPNRRYWMQAEYRWKEHYRPCLWCNHTPVVTRESDSEYSVKCRCGLEFNRLPSRSEAIWRWNTRYGE